MTAETQQADRLATLERRLAMLERTSLNSSAGIVAVLNDPSITVAAANAGFSVPFNTPVIDTAGVWNSSTPDVLVIPRPGVYLVVGYVGIPGASGKCSVFIGVDNMPPPDTPTAETSTTTTFTFAASVPLLARFPQDAEINLILYHESGGSRGFSASLSLVYVGGD